MRCLCARAFNDGDVATSAPRPNSTTPPHLRKRRQYYEFDPRRPGNNNANINITISNITHININRDINTVTNTITATGVLRQRYHIWAKKILGHR